MDKNGEDFWSRDEEQQFEHDKDPSKDENVDDDKFNKIINKIFNIINSIETKFLPRSEEKQLES